MLPTTVISAALKVPLEQATSIIVFSACKSVTVNSGADGLAGLAGLFGSGLA